MINEQLQQIKEIIESNGRCPSDPFCNHCICYPLLAYGSKGCNPAKAIDYIKETYPNLVKIVIAPKLSEEIVEILKEEGII